ncbi:hypothetical protein PFISCL1PPCAC_1126, partial [Pristionchus fissidentatus]
MMSFTLSGHLNLPCYSISTRIIGVHLNYTIIECKDPEGHFDLLILFPFLLLLPPSHSCSSILVSNVTEVSFISGHDDEYEPFKGNKIRPTCYNHRCLYNQNGAFK